MVKSINDFLKCNTGTQITQQTNGIKWEFQNKKLKGIYMWDLVYVGVTLNWW